MLVLRLCSVSAVQAMVLDGRRRYARISRAALVCLLISVVGRVLDVGVTWIAARQTAVDCRRQDVNGISRMATSASRFMTIRPGLTVSKHERAVSFGDL